MSAVASYDFTTCSYTITVVKGALEFKPAAIKKPIDETIAEVIRYINLLPEEEATRRKLLPARVKQQVGISQLLRSQVKQLIEFGNALIEHLGKMSEHKKQANLTYHINTLEALLITLRTTDDIAQFGKALISRKGEIATSALLTKLRDYFFTALDGCMAVTAKEATELNKLIVLARELGKEFIALSFTEDKRTTVLLRSDIPEAINKIRAAFIKANQQYTYDYLVTVGTILTSLPIGFVEADPTLTAEKATFLEKYNKTDVGRDPLPLLEFALTLVKPFKNSSSQQPPAKK